MAEQTRRVPEGLALVFHRSHELRLFCPFPVSFLDFSAKEAAEDLLSELFPSPSNLEKEESR